MVVCGKYSCLKLEHSSGQFLLSTVAAEAIYHVTIFKKTKQYNTLMNKEKKNEI